MTSPHWSSEGASSGETSRAGRSGVWTMSKSSSPFFFFFFFFFLSSHSSLLLDLRRLRSRSFWERLLVELFALVEGVMAMAAGVRIRCLLL
jgi:hypothetical protein